MEGFRGDISLLFGLEETYDHSHLQGLGLVNICVIFLLTYSDRGGLSFFCLLCERILFIM